MINDSVAVILDAKWKPADWSAVADELTNRLEKVPKTTDDSWHRNYQRDRMSGWLLSVLENAGRGGELLAIYESKSPATGSYERLVRYLIAEKASMTPTLGQGRNRKDPREVAGYRLLVGRLVVRGVRGRKQWDIVAAHAAWQFFERPGG